MMPTLEDRLADEIEYRVRTALTLYKAGQEYAQEIANGRAAVSKILKEETVPMHTHDSACAHSPKKGTHGVLTNSNSGVTIPATFHNATSTYINVIIDGTSPGNTNTFYTGDGWTFAPDLALPTKPGSVVRLTGGSKKGSSWLLMSSGMWVSQSGITYMPSEVLALIERNNFDVQELS